MITYRQSKWKEFKGEYQATVVSVTPEENNFYNPEEPNSTDYVLTVELAIVDKPSLEEVPFTQKFVTPLTGGNSLFQGLMDAKEFLPDEDGGTYDEQNFVGAKLLVTFAKNKKNYDTIVSAKAIDGAMQKAKSNGLTPPVGKDEKVDDDLPFGN